jgi:hypothetical protein
LVCCTGYLPIGETEAMSVEIAEQTARTAATAGATREPGDWLGPGAAAALMNRPRRVVARLAQQGHIRVHRPPGCAARYYGPDVRRLSPAAVLEQETASRN